MIKYYWVRIYDYKVDFIGEDAKGTMLDEYYIHGEELSRNVAKSIVKERSNVNRFAKPKNTDGLYAIVMDSSKSYADYFSERANTKCLCCNCDVKGKAHYFPQQIIDGKKYLFCSWECKQKFNVSTGMIECDWQNREGSKHTGNIGYIYHIYNRATDMHYVGQSLYMPFFRWQEHVKSKLKGDLCELVFDVITEVPYLVTMDDASNKKNLNDIESWWIKKFIQDYGEDHVMNITKPELKIQDYISKWERVVDGNLNLFEYIGLVNADDL